MTCHICSNESPPLFSKLLLGKYNVDYFKCSNCEFIQTEKPYWLQEAYQNSITALDIGLVYRNQYLSTVAQALITRFFNPGKKFLDFGGGYGLFVRMMRDRGFDFYRQDKYCENLFAKNFDISDLPEESKSFELVTSFELFEHLENPMNEIQKMLSTGNSILFSTEVQPTQGDISSWEYLAPETGQHIALYSVKTLQTIARKFKLNIYTNSFNIHLLTPLSLSTGVFKILARPKIAFVYNLFRSNRQSLLEQDYSFIKQKLSQSI
ncbi:MAG TPA: class I SAM-dependent methyltransferase [Ohtaekwangia sp.]|uniref:class I SAM-dependent methyltransferase n=1 Tax=Ohtaekwangia sp. TaxID=2066019 RepID=UPI002F9567F4